MTDTDAQQPTETALLLQALAKAKLAFLAAAVVSALLAVMYLRTADYQYSVTYTVVPAQRSSSQSGGSGLAGLASAAGLNISMGDTVQPLDLYIEQLHSRAVADLLASREDIMRRVFAAEWDASAKQWREPKSAIRSLSRGVKTALGLPVIEWRPPDGARFQSYLEDKVAVEIADEAPIATVAIDHGDPDFAITLLTALHRATDGILRRAALQKSGEYIGYLRATIPSVQIVEARTALAGLLTEQEKVRMIASSSTPYAADLIDRPHASSAPTSPRPMLILLGSILVGLALTLAGVLLSYQLRRSI